MKKQVTAILIASAFASGAALVHADHHGDKGDKMRMEKQDMDRTMKHEREHMEDMHGAGDEHRKMEESKEMKEKREKLKEEKAKMNKAGDDAEDDARGMEKQMEMKSEQERKELGKGSEKGQAMREEKSKKWWKFWE